MGSENLDNSFKKEERLTSKKQFDKLFAEGISIPVYPLRIIFIESDFSNGNPAKVAFAVSKKNFKKAVNRNLIKRRMREAYRLNKHLLYSSIEGKKLAIIFIYIAREIELFSQIQKSLIKGISSIADKLDKS